MIRDHIALFIPTSISPWHPSTDGIERAISSAWALCGDRIRPLIHCDGVPPWASEEEIAAYCEYLRAVRQLPGAIVQVADEWHGLAGSVRQFISDLDHPLVLNVQHDWEFVETDRVDMPELVAEMMHPRSPVQYVRFHRRKMTPAAASRGNLNYESISPPDGLPLLASPCWGDSPHLATAEHYLDCVAKHMVCGNGGLDGRYGLERPLAKAYRQDRADHGVAAAHARWGSWFYGRVGDEPYIVHTGRAAAGWRKRKGLYGAAPVQS